MLRGILAVVALRRQKSKQLTHSPLVMPEGEQVLIDGNRVYRYLIAMLHREAEKGSNRDDARLFFFRRSSVLPVAVFLQNATQWTLDCCMPVLKKSYLFFFLCLFFLRRFLRLCVAILCLFLFLPQGMLIEIMFFKIYV